MVEDWLGGKKIGKVLSWDLGLDFSRSHELLHFLLFALSPRRAARTSPYSLRPNGTRSCRRYVVPR